MNNQLKVWLVWTPRVLAIAFILFLALFATDVFGAYETIWETVVALFMHLIPNLILLLALIIAWRWKLIGGITFLVLGAISVFAYNTTEQWISFVVVSLPAYVVGVLFILDGLIDQFNAANVQS